MWRSVSSTTCRAPRHGWLEVTGNRHFERGDRLAAGHSRIARRRTHADSKRVRIIAREEIQLFTDRLRQLEGSSYILTPHHLCWLTSFTRFDGRSVSLRPSTNQHHKWYVVEGKGIYLVVSLYTDILPRNSQTNYMQL